MLFTILICTRNSSASLAQTIQAIDCLDLPKGANAELIVVDNASTDGTAELLHRTTLSNIAYKHLYEKRPGVSNARNTALASASGEIIAFTDDDVVPASDWLLELTRPLLANKFDAVTGHIKLGDHLERNWLTSLHRTWLASQSSQGPDCIELVGANMGFTRRVLNKVPLFDPELGPGALGFGDDTLFSDQLHRAEFRLGWVPEAKVTHNPRPDRLTRGEWLKAAAKRGATEAYLLHHWHHKRLKLPRTRGLWYRTKLALRRSLHKAMTLDQEGCALWEISYVGNIALLDSFTREYNRKRKYSRHGLVKNESSLG